MAEGAGDGPLRYYKSSEAIIYFYFCCTQRQAGQFVCACRGNNNNNDSYALVTAHCMPLYKFFDALFSQIYRQTADIFPQKLFHYKSAAAKTPWHWVLERCLAMNC